MSLSHKGLRVNMFCFHSICLIGSKLLASSSYHKCSTNDSLLLSAYGNNEEFWKHNPLSYVCGVPGITSGFFSGKNYSLYLTAVSLIHVDVHGTLFWLDPKHKLRSSG